jgi:hypothetical protein
VFVAGGELERGCIALAGGAPGIKGDASDRTILPGPSRPANLDSEISVLQLKIDLHDIVTRRETNQAIATQIIRVYLAIHFERRGGKGGPTLLLALSVPDERMHCEVGGGAAVVEESGAADGGTAFETDVERCRQTGFDLDDRHGGGDAGAIFLRRMVEDFRWEGAERGKITRLVSDDVVCAGPNLRNHEAAVQSGLNGRQQ